jgi:hypothetical protein
VVGGYEGFENLVSGWDAGPGDAAKVESRCIFVSMRCTLACVSAGRCPNLEGCDWFTGQMQLMMAMPQSLVCLQKLRQVQQGKGTLGGYCILSAGGCEWIACVTAWLHNARARPGTGGK